MNEWLIQQGLSTPQTALIVGLLAGLLVAVALAWIASRRSARASSTERIEEVAGR